MIPYKIEKLIWEGKASFKSQTFGFGEQFIIDVEARTFIIITGFTFSPRAFSLNSPSQSADEFFLLQQLIFSSGQKSNSFIYKPFFNIISKSTDTLSFAEIIQEKDIYMIYDSDVSIFMFITDINATATVSDALATSTLMRPNITAGGTAAITNVTDVLPGVNYAPLHEYGEEIGLPKSGQKSLVISKGAFVPVTTDPSNFPFLTVDYYLIKMQKPEQLQ